MRFNSFTPDDLYKVLKTKEDCLRLWMEMTPSDREQLYDLVKKSYQNNRIEECEVDNENIKEILEKISEPLIQYKHNKDIHPTLLYSLIQTNVIDTRLRSSNAYHDLVVAAELKAKYDNDIDVVSRISDSNLRDTLRIVLQDKYKFLGITATQILRDITKSRNKSLQIGDKKDVYTINDLYSASDFLSYTVDRFITKSGLFLLAAAPKTYKSLLSYHLAYSVVRGEPFLGRFETTKGKVLYIQLEENKETIKSRLRNIGFTEEDNDNFLILRKFDLTDTDRLQEIIHDFRPNLVIVDTLRAVTTECEVSENTAEFARPLYQLQALAQANDIAILVLHHKNKSNVGGINAVSGTSAIAGATDGLFLLDNYQDKLLLTTIPRNNPQTAMIISYKGQIINGKYRFVFNYETEAEIQGKDIILLNYVSEIEKEIENHVKSSPLREIEFDKYFSGKRDVLERLMSFGLIINSEGYLVWHRNYQPPEPSQEIEEPKSEDCQSPAEESIIPKPPELWENPESSVSETVFTNIVSQLPPDSIQVENGEYVDIVRFKSPEQPTDTVFEADINKTKYDVDKAQPEVIFRAPKAYFERVAPKTQPRIAVHVKDRLYYRRVFNPSTIEAHVSRVLSLFDFLSLYELSTEYDINQVREHVNSLPKSKQALFKWMVQRYKVCITKDMPHILSDPPFTAIYTQFGDSGAMDFFFPTRLESKYDIQFRAYLESLSLTDIVYEYHKVPPPKEAYCELHPAKISLRKVLPIFLGETDITAAFLDQAAELWGTQVAKELRVYVESAHDPYLDELDFDIQEAEKPEELPIDQSNEELPIDQNDDDVEECEDEFLKEMDELINKLKAKKSIPALDVGINLDNAGYSDVVDENKDEYDDNEIITGLDKLTPDELLLDEAVQWYLSMPEDFQEMVTFDEFLEGVKG